MVWHDESGLSPFILLLCSATGPGHEQADPGGKVLAGLEGSGI